jgi:putative ABC transport system permease protein
MIGIDRAVIRVNGDAHTEVQKMLNQPERVGLFGVLNVGFIATGLMPGVGFLLYSYASLRRRFIQLGILQAIGLSVKQLIGYLALEQFLLMGVAIVTGAIVGLVTSYMFVPFLQIGASREAPVPPFEVLIGWTESAYLSLGFGLVLFMTMIGTILYLAQMKVFQAVKMGESM